MSLLFADHWDYGYHCPEVSLQFDQVAERMATGKIFAAVGGWDGDGSIPEFVVEYAAHAAIGLVVSVHQFYPSGSVATINEFYEVDKRLFMSRTFDYSYPDTQNQYDLFDATTLLTFNYKPDGSADLEIDDDASPMLETREYRDVDVSQHWEEIPKTPEDFERLGRLETFLADKE